MVAKPLLATIAPNVLGGGVTAIPVPTFLVSFGSIAIDSAISAYKSNSVLGMILTYFANNIKSTQEVKVKNKKVVHES